MASTITDIAARTNSSVSTVSRVLNKQARKYRISKEKERLILEAAREMNYRPNHVARGLRLKKTQTIGLVVPDISNPFFAYVTRVIQTFAWSSGYSLIVCNTDESLQSEVEQIELLRSKGVDGLIIMPVGVKYNHLAELLEDGLPLVLLDRCFDELATNSVIVNDYKGAFEAVNHLLEHGHTRIAIIQGLPNTQTNRARLRGYRDALASHGITPNDDYIVGNDFRKKNGYIETKLLLKLAQRPTALFTTSDLITLGALQALYEEDCHIPQDLSLVAFDDTEFAPFLAAPLTAVSQPKELMGEIAVKLLIEEMKGKGQKEKKRIVLEPQLIVRKSVASAPPFVH